PGSTGHTCGSSAQPTRDLCRRRSYLLFLITRLSYRTMTLRRTLLTAAALALALPTAWASMRSASTSGPDEGESPAGFHDQWIQRGRYRIHAREQHGAGPTIVLMHGFPDNH